MKAKYYQWELEGTPEEIALFKYQLEKYQQQPKFNYPLPNYHGWNLDPSLNTVLTSTSNIPDDYKVE